MKLLALGCGVAALLAVSGCGSTGGSGSSEEAPESGLTAASDCMLDGGATKIQQTDNPRSITVMAAGPDGSLVYAGRTQDRPTTRYWGTKLRQQQDVLTWITPDGQAIAATDQKATLAEWKLALKCALVLPDEPGKNNIDFGEINTEIARNEMNMAKIETICDVRVGTANLYLIELASQTSANARQLIRNSELYEANALGLALKSPEDICPEMRRQQGLDPAR